jgi:hypothetical protein
MRWAANNAHERRVAVNATLEIAINTAESKLFRIEKTREWLASFEADEDITVTLTVLDATIEDFKRVQSKRAINGLTWYRLRAMKLLAGALLSDFLADHADKLTAWDASKVPEDAHELMATVFSDCLHQLTWSLETGRRHKGFTPLTEQEIAAVTKLYNL